MRLHGLLSFPLTPFTSDDRSTSTSSPSTSTGRSTRGRPRCSSRAAPGSSPRSRPPSTRDVVRTAVRVADGRSRSSRQRRRPADGARVRRGGARVRGGRAAAAAAVPGVVHAGGAGASTSGTSPTAAACRSSSTSGPTRCSTRRPRSSCWTCRPSSASRTASGDVDAMLRLVTAVRTSGHARAESFGFLNGLPTAELSVQAYRRSAWRSYSSAVLMFAPDIATAFYRAVTQRRQQPTTQRLLAEFYLPFAALRDEVPGYAVALVKAGARLAGLAISAASVRRWSTPRPSTSSGSKGSSPPAARRSRSRRQADEHHRGRRHADRVPRSAAAQLLRGAPAVGAAHDRRDAHAATASSGSARPTATPAHLELVGTGRRGAHWPRPVRPERAATRRIAQALGERGRAGPARPDRRFQPAEDARCGSSRPFEVACLDLQGRATGRPLHDLLGGKVRDAVPYSAYLFYKWASHPDAEPDTYGEAIDPDGIVAQARQMIDQYGFGSIKLKGGVFPPEEEIAAIRALRETFPDHPLRLDPNAAWTVDTSIKVAEETDGPAGVSGGSDSGIAGMARGGREAPHAAGHEHVRGELRRPARGVRARLGRRVLVRPPLLGRAARVAAPGRHLRDVRDRAVHALQQPPRHQPRRDDAPRPRPRPTLDVRLRHPHAVAARRGRGRAGPLSFVDGAVPVPDDPGLGVELDRDALARMHENYLRCGIRERDDTGYMRIFEPDYERRLPRW